MYAPDGRFSREGVETAYNVLREFDQDVKRATIDVTKTYTDDLVAKAAAR